MNDQSITHDRDELEVNFVLVFLVISLELVKLGQHDGLFRVEVSADEFSDVGD